MRRRFMVFGCMLEPRPRLRPRDPIDEPEANWSSDPRLTLREVTLMLAAAVVAALTVATLAAFLI